MTETIEKTSLVPGLDEVVRFDSVAYVSEDLSVTGYGGMPSRVLSLPERGPDHVMAGAETLIKWEGEYLVLGPPSPPPCESGPGWDEWWDQDPWRAGLRDKFPRTYPLPAKTPQSPERRASWGDPSLVTPSTTIVKPSRENPPKCWASPAGVLGEPRPYEHRSPIDWDRPSAEEKEVEKIWTAWEAEFDASEAAAELEKIWAAEHDDATEIVNARRGARMTIKDLAQASGVSERTIKAIEAHSRNQAYGPVPVKAATLEKIRRALIIQYAGPRNAETWTWDDMRMWGWTEPYVDPPEMKFPDEAAREASYRGRLEARKAGRELDRRRRVGIENEQDKTRRQFAGGALLVEHWNDIDRMAGKVVMKVMKDGWWRQDPTVTQDVKVAGIERAHRRALRGDFDPGRGVKFTTWVWWQLESGMRDAIKRMFPERAFLIPLDEDDMNAAVWEEWDLP